MDSAAVEFGSRRAAHTTGQLRLSVRGRGIGAIIVGPGAPTR